MAYNRIYTVIGARSSGKTPLILGGDYERGLAALYLNKGMSVLIIDEIDHPKYRGIPFIHPKNYRSLSDKPIIRRTLCKMHEMNFLFPHLLNVWNTLIVFEDCYKYIPQKITKDQMSIIGNSKNQNNCLVFMYWCWGLAAPDILRMTNYYVIFPTSDSPEDRKSYIKGCFPKCMQAYEEVKNITSGLPYRVVDSGI